MSYQLKRINPFWLTHPMIPTGVAVGAICGVIGYVTQRFPIALIGGGVAGVAVFLAARPVVSSVCGLLGLLGGMVRFVLIPDVNLVGMSPAMRLVSALLFALFYMVLMDALVLVIAVLYNLFAGVFGLGG